MIIKIFTYYEHLSEINELLRWEWAFFIDGETYEVGLINGQHYIEGNFTFDWVYKDRTGNQSFPIENQDLKKILRIVEPLKFKQIG